MEARRAMKCDSHKSRVVSWFSAGAASAVATKLALSEYGDQVVIAYADLGESEHPDNQRFIAECEEWFGQSVVRLRSKKYRDIWQVFEERRFLVGPDGALCTTELKKKVRQDFQRPDDLQVFGYTVDKKDAKRADRFRQQNPEVTLLTPLIERGLTKADCLGMVKARGIELPVMYRLGFANNNCVGCVKGGMGYWNQIRRHFPDRFERMAKLERDIGYSLLSDTSGPVWLDELDPDRGDYQTEPDIECSLLCAAAEREIA
jgi:hypothetical protein